MKTLNQNIKHIFGKKGEDWLLTLTHQIERLSAHWQLTELTPVANMTFNYVAYAVSNHTQRVVLKITCDEKSMQREKQALIYFNGRGAIQLIDAHATCHALLLQQAVPGKTLTSLYPENVNYVMDAYVATMQKLHSMQLPDDSGLHSIRDWLKAIDQFTPNHTCPDYLLEKARSLKNALLSSMKTPLFLHGDLHHDNILQQGDTWLAIDPKGIVGEAEFEIAAFDFMYINELANTVSAKEILENRIALLAKKISFA